MTLFREFSRFARRGNIMDLAIGFTVGAAFNSIAKSLVDDILMPPLGLLLGRADFAGLFLVLSPGPDMPPPYPTLAAAESAGAVTLNYGAFINSIVAFLIVALVMFLIIRGLNRIDEELDEHFGEDKAQPEEPTEKKCRFCRSIIAYRAIRCPRCTSNLIEVAQPAPTAG